MITLTASTRNQQTLMCKAKQLQSWLKMRTLKWWCNISQNREVSTTEYLYDSW